jgi:hypothetical protein
MLPECRDIGQYVRGNIFAIKVLSRIPRIVIRSVRYKRWIINLGEVWGCLCSDFRPIGDFTFRLFIVRVSSMCMPFKSTVSAFRGIGPVGTGINLHLRVKITAGKR